MNNEYNLSALHKLLNNKREELKKKEPTILEKYYPGFVIGEGYILEDEPIKENENERISTKI